jgi:hypothetical protein
MPEGMGQDKESGGIRQPSTHKMQTHKRSSDVPRKHSDKQLQQMKTNKRKARK